MTKFQPAIKWSGSKRSQSERIVELFPKKMETYYEPFVGGGSILMQLLLSEKSANRYVCSDSDRNLIALWKQIVENHLSLSESYERMWKELNSDDDMGRKKDYYYSIRSRFNQCPSPDEFLFIMRTTVNGMPRYNQKGLFNNAFHVTRNGIKPETLRKILSSWNKILCENDVEFHCRDFSIVESLNDDVIYLDPPYANTKGMYGAKMDAKRLWEWMRNQRGKYFLSYDGRIDGKEDMTFPVPEDLFSEHLYLNSGNSSFRRTIGKSKDSIVFESLYIK